MAGWLVIERTGRAFQGQRMDRRTVSADLSDTTGASSHFIFCLDSCLGYRTGTMCLQGMESVDTELLMTVDVFDQRKNQKPRHAMMEQDSMASTTCTGSTGSSERIPFPEPCKHETIFCSCEPCYPNP